LIVHYIKKEGAILTFYKGISMNLIKVLTPSIQILPKMMLSKLFNKDHTSNILQINAILFFGKSKLKLIFLSSVNYLGSTSIWDGLDGEESTQ